MSGVSPTLLTMAATALYRARLLTTVSRAADWGRDAAFQILTYHRVNDDDDPFFPATPTTVFDSQMRHVAAAYTVLPVEELVDCAERGRLPRHALAITFDDGYRDNLTHAAPIIARYALRPTIFVATSFVGSRRRPWFDEVALAFKSTSAISATMPWGRTVALRDREDRLKALDEAWKRLKAIGESEFDAAFDRLLRALEPYRPPADEDADNGMLNWNEVKALAAVGFTVGAHTVTHPTLSRVSAARARREIEDSREAIRVATGTAPRAFAYPNGRPADYTDEVVRLVRQAGFACAVTARFGVNTAATSPWELRRGGPWEPHLPTFALKLAGYRFMRSAEATP
jgi:peptidoglycan/xylan/chitin deacetylase (PgdA/CDA1 family)